MADELAPRLDLTTFDNRVRAAVDVYYQRYHWILGRIAARQGDGVAEDVFGARDRRLILLMPGIGVFLALIKGWLGSHAAALVDPLAAHLTGLDMAAPADLDVFSRRLAALGAHFERHPCKAAIVTSSIRYEAEIVLSEVFRVLHGEMMSWPLPPERREPIVEAFAAYDRYYDAFITAADSSEIRLKPHRDLYSIALHRMGIAPASFDQVVGFEDSESGTIAIRATGIPCCCA
ncbi:MAG: HAD family phosphatase [bacterium]|nr:HAD family phosphatase [bacterium]